MQFTAAVQGKVYATIEAPNTGAALAKVTADIKAGLVPHFNPNKNHNILIKPV